MRSKYLQVIAGEKAFHHIKTNGLEPSDIGMVIGASGAAKWLAIYGLDRILFSQWFKDRKEPLYLFGTSIGAWKFAAAAQPDSVRAMDRLKDAYIHQYYGERITPLKISKETDRIISVFLSESGINNILYHPFLRIAFSAVRCKGLLASRLKPLQAAAMLSAFGLNALSRKSQACFVQRMIFHDFEYDKEVLNLNDFSTQYVSLNSENFLKAILASGSIPMVMEGVSDIPGAPEGVYRDGGLLDYHPIFKLNPDLNGLVLYPHFYPHITPGWFDKKIPHRRASRSWLDRVVIVSPTDRFVRGLPFGRIPDRKDFIRLKGKDAQRITAWKEAAAASKVLGESFMEAVESGNIKKIIQPAS